jgi:hypothetical protein
MMQAPLLNREKGTMDGEERECFRIAPFVFSHIVGFTAGPPQGVLDLFITRGIENPK